MALREEIVTRSVSFEVALLALQRWLQAAIRDNNRNPKRKRGKKSARGLIIANVLLADASGFDSQTTLSNS